MTDPHSPLLSMPFTPPRGQLVQPEYNIPISRNYGDPYVRTSSRRLLDRDNAADEGDNLRPEPSGASDCEVENKFAFSPGQLNNLLNPKDFGAFGALGGLRGLEKGLRTDVRGGLNMDETVLDGTVSLNEVLSRAFISPHDAHLEESAMKQAQDRFARCSESTSFPRRSSSLFGSSCGLRTMTRC
jgi:Ca2+-transporting ATPase